MTNPNQSPNPPYQPQPVWGQTPQPPLSPPPAPQKRPKRFGWVAASLFALGGLTLGGLVGGGDSTTTTAEPGPTTTVTATETTQAEASSEPTKPAPKKTTAPKPAATMGEGTYQIGVDAPAGRYKTVGEDNCYWERTKDDSGSFGSILANDNVNDGARASVTVKKGEFFTSSGCGTWMKVP